MINEGKKFEEDFRKSIPNEWLQLRLKDHAGWSHADDKRFTPTNPCDLMLFTGRTVYLLELKSSKVNRIPITPRLIKQATDLCKLPDMKYVKKAFLINFRAEEETYIVDIKNIMDIIHSGAKSIKHYHVSGCPLVPQIKKRTRYTYVIGDWE